MKKKDIYVIGCILLTALVLFVGIWFHQNNLSKRTNKVDEETNLLDLPNLEQTDKVQPVMAQVLYGGTVVMLEFDINEDAIYHLRGDVGHFDVEVKDGQFRMINVDCPNHNCEGMGWQPDNLFYMPIICIPNNVVVQLKEE